MRRPLVLDRVRGSSNRARSKCRSYCSTEGNEILLKIFAGSLSLSLSLSLDIDDNNVDALGSSFVDGALWSTIECMALRTDLNRDVVRLLSLIS